MAAYNGDLKRAQTSAKDSTKSNNFNQNQFFFLPEKTEDEYYDSDTGKNSLPDGKYVPSANGLAEDSTIAVIAVNGDAFSPMRETDIDASLAQLPTGLAWNQSIIADNNSEECNPTTSDTYCLTQAEPVTMADGHTAYKPAIFDASKTQKTGNTFLVPYRLQGTLITGWGSIYNDNLSSQDLKDLIAKINRRNLSSQPPTGAPDGYLGDDTTDSQTAKTGDVLTSSNTVSTTPTVDYPVNGSTPLVKFIAANLMAGNYRMDVANYYTDPTVDLTDAIYEAVWQNPYAMLVYGYMSDVYIDGGTTLVFEFRGVTAKRISDEQQALWNSVKTVAAQITNDGMSDRDKALAINKWLVDHATYDNSAYDCIADVSCDYFVKFPYAWNALGVQLHGTGVCASYAQAFKALADAAGLRAVYISGTDNASGGRHAWNKAFFDGAWRVVDPTWDDNAFEMGESLTAYFGLTDAASDRVQDDYFMVNRFISQFAAE